MGKKYLPPRQKSEFDVGERVVGKFRPVKIKGKKGIKVLWRSEEGDTKSESVLLADCKEDVQEDIMKVIKSKYDGEFQISLSSDSTSVVNFHPANGQFRVRVSAFPAKEGENPKPKVYTGGKFGDMIKFNTVLEIVAPKEVDGLTLPMQLFYEKFVPMIIEENKQIVGFSSPPGNSKHCDMLSDFCDATGLWEFGAIEWSENILPELERRILRLEREFNVVLGMGWVEHIYEIADYEEENGDEKSDVPWEEDETMDMSKEKTDPSGEKEEAMDWPED